MPTPYAAITHVLNQCGDVVVERADPSGEPRHLDVLHAWHLVPVFNDVSGRGSRQDECLAPVDGLRIGDEVRVIEIPGPGVNGRVVEGSKEVRPGGELDQRLPAIEVVHEVNVEIQVV